MNHRRFLYCRGCNAVHHVTPFDAAPVFDYDGANIREVPQDDRRAFTERHIGHRLDELTRVDELDDPRNDIVDVMKERYFAVTDGQALFLLRSFRRSIGEPLSFEVLPRQLTLWAVTGVTAENYGTGLNRKLSPRRSRRIRNAKTDDPLFLELRFP